MRRNWLSSKCFLQKLCLIYGEAGSRIRAAILVVLFWPQISCIAATTEFDCLLAGSTPEANANTLRAVAFGEDRFVAVGDAGTIMLSTNAISWARQATPTDAHLFTVTYGSGQFVAGGNFGTVLLSRDGMSWELASAGVTNHLRKIAFGNGSYVAYNDYKTTLFVSSDARTWQAATNINSVVNSYIHDVFFGGDRFVAMGNGFWTSSDGRNWANSGFPPVGWPLLSGTYGNGTFVISGVGEFGSPKLAHSTDLTSWTEQRQNGRFSAMCFGDGLFLGLYGGFEYGFGFQSSSDGEVWSEVTWLPEGRQLFGIGYGMGQFVAVGADGAIFTTTNTTQWAARQPPVCSITTLVEGNGITVGIVGGAMVSSDDNIHFRLRHQTGGFLTSLLFTNNNFYVGGIPGVFKSEDGIAWTSVPVPCLDDFWHVLYLENMLVGLCRKSIVTSTDGGAHWTTVLDNTRYIQGLLQGDGRWVAFGWDGEIYTSQDLLSWQDVSYPTPTPSDFGPAVFENGLYSLYGSGGFNVSPSAFVSRDGIQWFDTLEFGPLLSLRSAGNSNVFTLSLAGDWGRIYEMQSTRDFTAWSGMGKLTNNAGVTSITITNSEKDSPLFIRALETR